MKTFQDFLHIMDFNGNQMVQGPNESFSAASKGFKQHQTMNKGPFDSHWSPFYGENPGMFSSKTLISFWLKKEWHGHLGWQGG